MESRKEQVEAIYARWQRGEYRAGLELLEPDMTLEVHVPIPDAKVYDGLGGLQGYMRQFLETWEDYEIRALSVDERGDHVVVHVDHSGRASGLLVDTRFFMVWTFDGERVVRIDVAAEPETGLAAALDAVRAAD